MGAGATGSPSPLTSDMTLLHVCCLLDVWSTLINSARDSRIRAPKWCCPVETFLSWQVHREVDVWMPSHHVPDARRLPRSPSIPVSSRIFPRTTFSPGKGDPASTPVAHTGNMSMLSCHARGVHSCGETPPCSQPVSTLTCTSTHTNASLLHLPRISALSQLHAPDASGMVAATPKHTASLCRR